MNKWSEKHAKERIYQFDNLSEKEQKELLSVLDESFHPQIEEEQKLLRRRALDNLASNQHILSNSTQYYPECISSDDVQGSATDLSGYAIVLTAGGEGERLRLSLSKQGIAPEQLHNFTKATFPLPEFFKNYGTLPINLSLLSKICYDNNISIPVIVTTGPEHSATARVLPAMVKKHNSFGLKDILVIKQDERLHFTREEQIVYTSVNNQPRPVTNPDETGGPIMKLKKQLPGSSSTILDWLKQLGCNKIILLQATALYDPELILTIASAGKKYDGLGIGIPRKVFPDNDPFGTYVLLEQDRQKKLVIVEQEVRNKRTLSLKNPRDNTYLPLNTGLYAFDIDLIQNNELPDYAAPPKEILPGLPKSPKIGYAATDIISFAKKPAVLTVSQDSFGVIKNAGDLDRLTHLGKKFGLDKICKEIHEG